jgi:TRAP transporter TAXI family solute receptor
MKSISVIVGVVVAAFATVASAQQIYAIGTNQQGSIAYSAGAAVAKLMADKTGMQFRVQPGAGSSTFVPMMERGEIDFGFNNALEVSEAWNGKETFEGKPTKNMRLVVNVFPLQIGIAVVANGPIKTIKDGKGKTIPSDFTGQTTIRTVQEAILQTGGATQADFKGFPVPNYVKGMEALGEGKVDIALMGPGTGASREAHAKLSSQGGIRFIDLDTAAQARMKKLFPAAFLMKLEADPAVPGFAAPANVMAYPYFITTGTHVSDDVIYQLVKTLHPAKETLAAAFSQFKGFDQKGMNPANEVPYHPGALKAYRELGLAN